MIKAWEISLGTRLASDKSLGDKPGKEARI